MCSQSAESRSTRVVGRDGYYESKIVAQTTDEVTSSEPNLAARSTKTESGGYLH